MALSPIITRIRNNSWFCFVMIVQLCILPSYCQITQCSTYVQNLLNDLLHFKITSIPLPSLMYSGITANNAGQLSQCQLSNYSYYLTFLKNTTTMTQSYYGLCMPKQCTADDIQIALQFLRAKVYDMDGLTISNELLSMVAAIIVGVWISAVLLCSLWTYFRRHRINQYLNGEKNDSVTMTQTSNADHPVTQTYSQPSSSHDYSQFLLVYFQGYKKIFTQPSKPSPFSSILFLAVVSFAFSIQFSYRQNISQNITEIYGTLSAPFGVFVCNVEICLHTIIFILGYKMADKLDKIRRVTKIGRIYFNQIALKWLNLILMSLLVYAFSSYMIRPPLSKIWKDNNAKDCGNYIWQTWFSLRNLQLDCKICLPWFTLMQADLLLTLLSLPLVLIFRTTKKLGYFLYLILIGVSIFISYSILKNEVIVFQPYKLMNGQKQFWIDYQGNAFVRMAAYFTGFFLGLYITQAKDNTKQQTVQTKIANKLNKLNILKWMLCIVGLSLMAYCYIMIYPYLSPQNVPKQPFNYIVLCPLAFVVSLSLFTLPSILPPCQPPCRLSRFLTLVLCHPYWTHLHNISITAYYICPMVIAYSTYNSQNSIQYSIITVGLYLLGDLFICYFICILVTACFENMLRNVVQAAKNGILGKQMRYGDILVQYL